MLPRPLALLAVAMLALTACASPDAGVDLDEVDRGLAAQQQVLSEQALAGLATRRCPTLPEPVRLEDAPDDVLDCLGTGPARSAGAGDGRPTVVNLWASWCAPCVREMPALEKIYARTAGAVRFVGVDTQDERDSAASMLAATGVTYEQRDDPDGRVRAALRAPGLPATVVYDGRGREVARRIGEVQPGWLERALADAGVPALKAG